PLSLWGYHVRAVDDLLLRLTDTLKEREERIADLEWRLSRLDQSYVPEGTGPRPGSHLPGDAYAPEAREGESRAEPERSEEDDSTVGGQAAPQEWSAPPSS